MKEVKKKYGTGSNIDWDRRLKRASALRAEERLAATKRTVRLAVSGILYERGRVLLGKRDDFDPGMPGMWCAPGGGVEHGERLTQALAREFSEEVGIEVSTFSSFLSVQERIADRHTVIVFFEVVNSGKATARPLDGFSEVRWFGPAELLKLNRCGKLTPSTAAALDEWAVWKSRSGDDFKPRRHA